MTSGDCDEVMQYLASCDEVMQHLYEYLDSEMTTKDAERMQEHVARCSPCLAELGVEEMVKRLVRRSCAEQAPAELRTRIHAQIAMHVPPPGRL